MPLNLKCRFRALALAGCAAAALGAPARAQPAAAAYDIPAGDLKQALKTFVKQGNVDVLFTSAEVADKATSGFRGRAPAPAVLDQLLVGTGLHASATNKALVVLEDGRTEEPAQRPPDLGATAQTALPGGGGGGNTLNEVVVTSTRIQSRGFVSPTPTTVVTSSEIQEIAATEITDLLKELPSVTNGRVGNGSPNTAGENNINLRGLNSQTNTRSLVLVDGQRYAPTDQYGRTDVSVIPTGLVDRIDVVTGGASAAWGSDAVAGVVNVVLKQKLEGLQGNFQLGDSQRNDFGNAQASLAWGSSFAGGRGQIMIAAEGSGLWNAPTAGSRKWGAVQSGFVTETINGVKYSNVLTNNLTLLKDTAGGVIIGTSNSLTVPPGNTGLAPTSPLYGLQIGANGALAPFVYTTNPAVTSTQYGVGGSGGWTNSGIPLGSPETRANLFTKGSYEITDKIKASFSFGFSSADVNAEAVPGLLPGGTAGATGFIVSQSNPYLQALTSKIPTGAAAGQTLYQAMVNNKIQTIVLGRINPDLGQLTNRIQTNLYNFSAALNGDFGENGHWTTYLSEGYSDQHVNETDNILEANLRAALDPITVNGQIVCNPTLVSQYGASPGCVPINPFGGPNSISAAAAQYVDGTLTIHNVNNIVSGGATIQASPISDWAGPVALAAGIEARRVTLASTTNSNGGAQTFNYGATVSGPFESGNPKSVPSVGENVGELFIEAGVPLLTNLRFAKSLEANLAYRITDYSVNGAVSSYKLGMTYRPVNGLLFRVTDSQDIRAPNLSELYGGATSGPSLTSASATATTFTDPQNPGLVYVISTIAQGNPNLKPEIAHTLTYGVTASPEWAPGLSASVDVYRVEIDNEISSLGATNIVNGCYGLGAFASVGPQPYYCSFISRPGGPGTQISQIFNENVNVGYQLTHGIDYEIDYRTRLDRFFRNAPGIVSFRALATNLQENATKPVAALPTVTDVAGTNGNPKFRFFMTSNYKAGPISLNVINRYVGSTLYVLDNSAVAGAVPYYQNTIKSIWYTDMQVAFNVNKGKGSPDIQFYFNVNNLFDKAPPLNVASSIGNYDVIGRAFLAGMRFKY